MVQGTSKLLGRSAEIGRMMTVVGEEGISIDDLVAFLKGEMFDAAYLQQNAFDKVDASTTIDRQVRDMKLMWQGMATDFEFENKPAARQFFATLQDAYYQKNYCADDTDDYANYENQITEMIGSGGQA